MTKFSCNEDAQIGKKSCIFHDKNFLRNKNNHKIVKKKFLEKICDSKNKKIECIGYYLPSLNFDKNPSISLPIYFDNAIFVDKLDLSKNIFTKKISFAYVKFKKGANFFKTVFNENTSFSGAMNNEQINFQFCKFKKSTNFKECKFMNANFKNVDFHEIDFTSTIFKGSETSFWNANFHEDITFARSSFISITNFKNSVFHNAANFEDVIFKNAAHFKDVIFKKADKIIFNGNISQVSFLETKIEKIKFGNKISWEKLYNGELSHKLKIYESIGHKNFQYKIFDESELEKAEMSNILLESVRDIYRQLIENFDQQMRYDISGEFFVRELELRRKYQTIQRENKVYTIKKRIHKKHFSVLWFYNIIAQYGQSYKRPICFIIPIIISSTLYFWLSDICTCNITNMELFWNSLHSSFLRSLNGFFPFYDFNKEVEKTIIDFILKITLLPIMGTFFVALKRRLERKFRH